MGGGVIGAATAWQLSEIRRSVVLLEQFAVGHDRGSSHGASRIFRFSYDDPTYVAMAIEALPLWRQLEAEAGRQVLSRSGGLDWGKDLDPHTSALDVCEAPYEVMDGAEARNRYPMFAPPVGEPVLFQGDAGVLSADTAWRTFAERAVARGVELREGARVEELRIQGELAEAVTDGETYRAPAVVVTAGAWARNLLAGVGIDLPVEVSRQTVAYMPVIGTSGAPVAVEWGATTFYALPSSTTEYKVGEHMIRETADPDEPEGPDQDWVERLEAWVADRVPGAEPHASRAETCLYTSTSDERFILERHGPVVVGSACSGHAFKFAPLLGRRLADLALSS